MNAVISKKSIFFCVAALQTGGKRGIFYFLPTDYLKTLYKKGNLRYNGYNRYNAYIMPIRKDIICERCL